MKRSKIDKIKTQSQPKNKNRKAVLSYEQGTSNKVKKVLRPASAPRPPKARSLKLYTPQTFNQRRYSLQYPQHHSNKSKKSQLRGYRRGVAARRKTRCSSPSLKRCRISARTRALITYRPVACYHRRTALIRVHWLLRERRRRYRSVLRLQYKDSLYLRAQERKVTTLRRLRRIFSSRWIRHVLRRMARRSLVYAACTSPSASAASRRRARFTQTSSRRKSLSAKRGGDLRAVPSDGKLQFKARAGIRAEERQPCLRRHPYYQFLRLCSQFRPNLVVQRGVGWVRTARNYHRAQRIRAFRKILVRRCIRPWLRAVYRTRRQTREYQRRRIYNQPFRRWPLSPAQPVARLRRANRASMLRARSQTRQLRARLRLELCNIRRVTWVRKFIRRRIRAQLQVRKRARRRAWSRFLQRVPYYTTFTRGAAKVILQQATRAVLRRNGVRSMQYMQRARHYTRLAAARVWRRAVRRRVALPIHRRWQAVAPLHLLEATSYTPVRVQTRQHTRFVRADMRRARRSVLQRITAQATQRRRYDLSRKRVVWAQQALVAPELSARVRQPFYLRWRYRNTRRLAHKYLLRRDVLKIRRRLLYPKRLTPLQTAKIYATPLRWQSSYRSRKYLLRSGMPKIQRQPFPFKQQLPLQKTKAYAKWFYRRALAIRAGYEYSRRHRPPIVHRFYAVVARPAQAIFKSRRRYNRERRGQRYPREPLTLTAVNWRTAARNSWAAVRTVSRPPTKRRRLWRYSHSLRSLRQLLGKGRAPLRRLRIYRRAIRRARKRRRRARGRRQQYHQLSLRARGQGAWRRFGIRADQHSRYWQPLVKRRGRIRFRRRAAFRRRYKVRLRRPLRRRALRAPYSAAKSSRRFRRYLRRWRHARRPCRQFRREKLKNKKELPLILWYAARQRLLTNTGIRHELTKKATVTIPKQRRSGQRRLRSLRRGSAFRRLLPTTALSTAHRRDTRLLRVRIQKRVSNYRLQAVKIACWRAARRRHSLHKRTVGRKPAVKKVKRRKPYRATRRARRPNGRLRVSLVRVRVNTRRQLRRLRRRVYTVRRRLRRMRRQRCRSSLFTTALARQAASVKRRTHSYWKKAKRRCAQHSLRKILPPARRTYYRLQKARITRLSARYATLAQAVGFRHLVVMRREKAQQRSIQVRRTPPVKRVIRWLRHTRRAPVHTLRGVVAYYAYRRRVIAGRQIRAARLRRKLSRLVVAKRRSSSLLYRRFAGLRQRRYAALHTLYRRISARRYRRILAQAPYAAFANSGKLLRTKIRWKVRRRSRFRIKPGRFARPRRLHRPRVVAGRRWHRRLLRRRVPAPARLRTPMRKPRKQFISWARPRSIRRFRWSLLRTYRLTRRQDWRWRIHGLRARARKRRYMVHAKKYLRRTRKAWLKTRGERYRRWRKKLWWLRKIKRWPPGSIRRRWRRRRYPQWAQRRRVRRRRRRNARRFRRILRQLPTHALRLHRRSRRRYAFRLRRLRRSWRSRRQYRSRRKKCLRRLRKPRVQLRRRNSPRRLRMFGRLLRRLAALRSVAIRPRAPRSLPFRNFTGVASFAGHRRTVGRRLGRARRSFLFLLSQRAGSVALQSRTTLPPSWAYRRTNAYLSRRRSRRACRQLRSKRLIFQPLLSHRSARRRGKLTATATQRYVRRLLRFMVLCSHRGAPALSKMSSRLLRLALAGRLSRRLLSLAIKYKFLPAHALLPTVCANKVRPLLLKKRVNVSWPANNRLAAVQYIPSSTNFRRPRQSTAPQPRPIASAHLQPGPKKLQRIAGITHKGPLIVKGAHRAIDTAISATRWTQLLAGANSGHPSPHRIAAAIKRELSVIGFCHSGQTALLQPAPIASWKPRRPSIPVNAPYFRRERPLRERGKSLDPARVAYDNLISVRDGRRTADAPLVAAWRVRLLSSARAGRLSLHLVTRAKAHGFLPADFRRPGQSAASQPRSVAVSRNVRPQQGLKELKRLANAAYDGLLAVNDGRRVADAAMSAAWRTQLLIGANSGHLSHHRVAAAMKHGFLPPNFRRPQQRTSPLLPAAPSPKSRQSTASVFDKVAKHAAKKHPTSNEYLSKKPTPQ